MERWRDADSGHPSEISLVSSRLYYESKHGAGRDFVHGARSEEAGKLSRQRKSPPSQRPESDCLISAENSLMTRFNSLLSPKKFPVRARREFPSTVLKLLPYFAPLPSPGGSNPTKFSVFSTEFPDHREYSTGRFFWAQQLIEDTREAGSEKRRSAGEI